MKKRFLLTSVLMLLLTVLALSTSTYAWFTMTSENYVDDISIVAAESTGGLQISATGDSWGDAHINVSTSKTAYDLTSDKDGNIYSRESDSKLTDITKTDNAQVEKYNQFDLYFKTTSYGAIVLDLSESYIIPDAYKDLLKDDDGAYLSSDEFVAAAVAKDNALAGKGWNLTKECAVVDGDATTYVDGDEVEKWSDTSVATKYNKSTYGDVSRDWIAAAFRMSFQVVGYYASNDDNYTGTHSATQPIQFVNALDKVSETKNTYNSKYSINGNGSAQTIKGVKAADTSVTPNVPAKILSADGDDDTGYTYTVKELLNDGQITIAAISDQTAGVAGTDNENQKTTDLKWEQGKNLFVKVRVRVWIEGQDREAMLPFTAGKIAAGLKFKLDQTGYANPTDYRTAVNFSTFAATADGFTWSIPTDAIDGDYVYIFNNLSNDPTAMPSVENTTDYFAKVAKANKGYAATVADGTYYIIAKVNYSTGKTGYKVLDGANMFKVLHTGVTGTPTEADYDYYVFASYTLPNA